MTPPDYMLVCRLCIRKNSSCVNIFDVNGTLEVRIADIINELLQLNIYPGDGLPENICCDCLNELARFKRFKNISHEAKLTLESVIKGKKDVTPQPSTSKQENAEKKIIHFVDLAENDDDSEDSLAETIAPPSLVALDDFGLDDEITPEKSSKISEICASKKEEPEREIDDEILLLKDPLESDDSLLESESGCNLVQDDDDDEADIVELEADDPPLETDIREMHCSRTLGYERVPKEEKTKTVDFVRRDTRSSSRNAPVPGNKSDSEAESEKTFKCLKCSKVFDDCLELKIHEEKDDCITFRCIYCNKILSTPRGLKKHETYCVKRKYYACEICDETFDTQTSLTYHVRAHQKKVDNKPVSKLYACENCDERFDSQSALSNHTRVHQRKVDNKQKKVCRQCKKCKRIFQRRKLFRCHVRKCKPPVIKNENCNYYVCGVCQEGFKNYYNFKRHFDAHMNIQKEARCGFCDVVISSSLELRKHVWKCHGSLECDFCSKTFLENRSLNRHLLTHSSGRQFACSSCGNSYKTKYSLNLHVSIAHTK